MPGLTYAKAITGPPDNWRELEVIDNTTGLRVRDVLEVNTMEGWVTHYVRDEDGDLATEDDHLVQETLQGRFRIVERK